VGPCGVSADLDETLDVYEVKGVTKENGYNKG
jgi:hypothetical protein